ncbi:unnamed protein product [Cuscuta europaea]|uniref:Uncharacterized protein n=1 Tax=Cuscuta europaea TaxID=41803 RepID=A0A9P0ZLI5_CUSEU|nr:unnamed protein product [Cuscuta europaea]
MGFSHDSNKRRACFDGGGGGHEVGCRGFRLNLRRFCVHRIRTRFLNLVGKWKTSYLHALRSLKRHVMTVNGKTKNRRHGKSGTMEAAAMKYALYHRSGSISCSGDHRPMLKSYGRSNSFYSDAIADCLDFIKRNSVSVEEEEEKPVFVGFREPQESQYHM